jgi:hypothetical protein
MQGQSQNFYNFYFDSKIYFVHFQSLNLRDERKKSPENSKGSSDEVFHPSYLALKNKLMLRDDFFLI